MFTEVEKKEKKERFEHTWYVAYYAEAYVNKEKAEELNRLLVIEAWERFTEQ